jgi:hypothetical protein
MSDCSGPNCDHPSHKSEKEARDVETMRRAESSQAPPKKSKPLTRNQRKAKRRKGIPGY